MITEDFIENPPFPAFTQFETGTACNADCLMCPHSKMKRKGLAKWSTIAKVIHEAAPRSGAMCPFLMQEPMLEPRLCQILANIKQNNPCCNTVLYSNLNLLNKDLERIIQFNLLDELHISFYGPTKELYQKYQPPLDWQQTQDNIKAVYDLKQKHSKTKPLMILHILAVPEILAESTKYTIGKYVNNASIVQFDTFHGDIPNMAGEQTKILGKPAERTPCQRLWTGLNIHFDGSVVPCCIDYNDEQVMGNVNNDTLEEIWNGDKFRRFRLLHTQKQWGQIELCKNCKVHEYQFSKEWIEYWNVKPIKESVTPTCLLA
jgi:radical SAM protein with 4Fe4S-binding SPASM domain